MSTPSGVLLARRASPCSPLLALPGAASAVLAWVPGAGCCFRLFVKNYCSKSLIFICARRYILGVSNWHVPCKKLSYLTWWTCSFHSMNIYISTYEVCHGSILRMLFFFWCAVFFHLFRFGARLVVSQPSTALGPDIYIYKYIGIQFVSVIVCITYVSFFSFFFGLLSLRYTICFSYCVYYVLVSVFVCFSSWVYLPLQSYWSLS